MKSPNGPARVTTKWRLTDGTVGEKAFGVSTDAELQSILNRVWRKFGDESKPLGSGSEFDRLGTSGTGKEAIAGKDEALYEALQATKKGRKGQDYGIRPRTVYKRS